MILLWAFCARLAFSLAAYASLVAFLLAWRSSSEYLGLPFWAGTLQYEPFGNCILWACLWDRVANSCPQPVHLTPPSLEGEAPMEGDSAENKKEESNEFSLSSKSNEAAAGNFRKAMLFWVKIGPSLSCEKSSLIG